MYVGSVLNLDSRLDCKKLEQTLSDCYDDDLRPYAIWILGDPQNQRIQVRLETGNVVGELSMNILNAQITDTDDLIRAVLQRIELMLDEAEACAR